MMQLNTFDEAIGFITEALDELLAARALATGGHCYEHLLKVAVILQIAFARALDMAGEAKGMPPDEGFECCKVCWQWKPESELELIVIEPSTKKAVAEGRKTSWWQCREACK